MNKAIIIIILALLILPSVLGAEVAYGYIKLNIVNQPPQLEDLQLQKTDLGLDCKAKIIDENPGTTKVIETWYANDMMVDKSQIKYGDNVKCELVPVDELGQEGAIYSIMFKMPEPKLKLMQSLSINF